MKKEITLIPRGYRFDKLIIDVKKKFVYFDIFCDGTGFSVKMSKDKLKELLE